MNFRKDSYSKIQTNIINLIFVLSIVFSLFSVRTFSNNLTILFYDILVIIFSGICFFIIKVIKDIKYGTYKNNKRHFRNIGGIMGLLWYSTTHICVVFLIALQYQGVCSPLNLWGGPDFVHCTLFEFLFSAKDFSAGLGVVMPFFLLSVPVILYIFGFLADRYVAKKR